jgi:hypothetical protein
MITSTKAPPPSTTAAAAPSASPVDRSPDDFGTGATPVSGAPLGTTATWLGAVVGPGVGALLALRVGSVVALGTGLGTLVALGAADAEAVATLVGDADAPWAKAGTVLASTAPHASAMALRTVRRMNRSLSSAGPPVRRCFTGGAGHGSSGERRQREGGL